MKFNRKTIISIFLLFLFSGSIFISAAQLLFKPKPAPMQIAVIETSMGTIEIELDAEKAPITVANFVEYANSGFYEGICFHRVINGFMIQGGGFDTEGKFKTPGPPIVNEANNGLINVEGTIAMARTEDPDTASSQFFINTADNDFLNYQGPSSPGYAVFGRVIKGLDIVHEIEGVTTTTREAYFPEFDFNQPMENWPVEDVIINSVTIKDS